MRVRGWIDTKRNDKEKELENKRKDEKRGGNDIWNGNKRRNK